MVKIQFRENYFRPSATWRSRIGNEEIQNAHYSSHSVSSNQRLKSLEGLRTDCLSLRVSVFGLIHVCCVLRATCSCVWSSHPWPSHCVGVSMPGPTSPPMPRMASGTQRQLSAVLLLRCRGTRIRHSGIVEFGICVLTAMKCPQSQSMCRSSSE